MKRLKFFLPLLIISIIFGGCPYSTEVPIDNPSVKINPALLGKWQLKSSDKDVYLISRADSFTYRIEKSGEESKNNSIYKAYLSNVDGDLFMNLKEEGGQSDGKTFSLFKVELNTPGNQFTLKYVTDNIDEKFTNSTQLKEFIRKYKELSFFYNKEEDIFFKIN